jgi:hypothetical protein
MLYNPETFSDRVMLDVPEIFVVYSLRDISRGDIHFREMRLSLKECVVVKDRYGELNVSSLKFFGNDRGREGPPKAWDVSRMRIDSLRLEIGRAIYKDYSQGATPAVKVFDIDINERFENISDLYALGRLIFLRSLTHTSIPILSNLNVEDLGTAVGVVVGKSGEVLKTTGGLAKDSVTGVGQAIQGVGGLLLNPGEDGKGK